MMLKTLKHSKKTFERKFIFCFFLLLASCQQLPLIEPNKQTDVREVQLGTSNYYLLLPFNFSLEEAEGKEGQLGYSINPNDTSSKMDGFIEIRHGGPISGENIFEKGSVNFVQSFLFNKKVIWKINKTDKGYFDAFTTESGDLNASASSKTKSEVEKIISIIATSKKK